MYLAYCTFQRVKSVDSLFKFLPDILSIMLCLSSGTGMSLLPSMILEIQGFHTHRSFAVMYPNRISECTNFKLLSERKFDANRKWSTSKLF